MTAPDAWCYHHEQMHAPMDWRDGCQDDDDIRFRDRHGRFQQAWQQVEESERDLRWWRRRAGRFRRWTVCWWKHRTRRIAGRRRLGDGVLGMRRPAAGRAGVTGPYRHVEQTTQLHVLSGRIELDCGTHTMVAEVRGGTADVQLVEEFDDEINAFGSDQPIRFVNNRRRLRLEIDAGMQEVTVTLRGKGESGS